MYIIMSYMIVLLDNTGFDSGPVALNSTGTGLAIELGL